MKKIIIGNCMNIIKKYQQYDEIKLEEIEYGLTAIYLTFSKLIIISIIAIILGIFKEMIIFLGIYNILRMPSFGLHATKSWICLLSSSIIFLGLPLICKYFNIDNIIKLVIGCLGIILMYKNSPADTEKRPIINKKRRLIYKLISTILAIIFVLFTLFIKIEFISNCLFWALILQNVLISPLTYRLFKLPYNNYKVFLKNNPDFIN